MIGFVLAVTTGVLALAGMVVLALRGSPQRTPVPRRAARLDARRGGAALVVGSGVLVLTRWPAAALSATAVVVLWPRIFGGAAAGRRSLTRLEALAVWTESLRDSTGSAAGLAQALPATLAGAPDVLRRPLVNLTARLDGRVPLPEALALFADDVDDPAADLVVAALCLNARQRAGGLSRILTSLAATTRQELEMQRAVEHERSSLRRQSQRIAAAVVGFAGVQALFARGWVAPYGSVLGQLALLVLIVIFVLAFVRMRTLANPPGEPRFLTDAHRVTEIASFAPRWGRP